MATKKILVVDDEASIRLGIKRFLEKENFFVLEAESCRMAQDVLQDAQPDMIILDYHLPDGHALNLLPKIKETHPEVPIIILTGHGTIDLAVRAIQEGAEQFLTKPIELPALLIILERCLENQRNRKKELAGKSRNARKILNPFLGISSAIKKLEEEVQKLILADSPILILGETGTGKGVLAHWLHQNGNRGEEPFVDLNCAGLNKEFLESELFGYEKGAYTGAVNRKKGLLEIAHHGSVFLDEIGDMDPSIQPKVLKVLEEKRFRKLGDVRDIQVDVRILFATHQDLSLLIQEKKFRQDLYYRINAFPIVIPSLKERIEDIPHLARHFIEAYSVSARRNGVQLVPEVEKTLMNNPWPGNIRELKNVVERALMMCNGSEITLKDLKLEFPPASGVPITPMRRTLADVEKEHIINVLRLEKGKVANAAEVLGIPKSSLYQKIKTLQISLSNL